MLRRGLEAGDLDAVAEAAIEAHQRTGRPWGGAEFIAALERRTGRRLAPQKPGRKPSRAAEAAE
jgi:putative transposase